MTRKKSYHPVFAAAYAIVLVVSTVGNAAEPIRAIGELITVAGRTEPPQVADVQGALLTTRRDDAQPMVDDATVACTMNIHFEEEVRQVLSVGFWKTLDGIADVSCDSGATFHYQVKAEGPSLGILAVSPRGIDTRIARSTQIRLPHPFHAGELSGTYLNAGGEVSGGGVAYSPWVNTNADVGSVIYLPASFNARWAVNLKSLKLRPVG